MPPSPTEFPSLPLIGNFNNDFMGKVRKTHPERQDFLNENRHKVTTGRREVLKHTETEVLICWEHECI